MKDEALKAFEDWLLNGNRFRTEPKDIFTAGFQAALAARADERNSGVDGDALLDIIRDAIAANDCRIIDSALAVREALRPYLTTQPHVNREVVEND